jgi:hypothetical protein
MNCMALPPCLGLITLACREQLWCNGVSRRDPEGNIWDVAWADGSTFDDRGGVVFP